MTGLGGPGRPQLYIDYSAIGVANTGQLGVTIKLLSRPEDAHGAHRWKPQQPQYLLRP
jgi:hypothetical protein